MKMKTSKQYKIFATMFAVMLLLSSFALGAETNEFASIKATLLNQDPDPAEPGEYVELRWNIQKLGNDELKELSFEIMPEYPFTVDEGESKIKNVGDLIGFSDDNTYYTLYYRLRVDDNALEDTYDVTLKYSYIGEKGVNNGEEEFEIRVGDKEMPNFVIGTIATSPTKLVGDTDEAELNIDIENIGDGDSENTKVELELPDGFKPSYSFSNREVLGTIPEESSKTATFYIDVDEDIKGGSYTGKLKLQYKEADDDDNTYKTIILPLEIQVMDKPLFEIVEVVTSPETITKEDKVELKFIIKNIGGKEGESVSVRAFKESSQPFEFEDKSDFIGKLKPGESGEAVLTLDVEKDATAKDYIIDLEIRSIDGDQVLLQEKSTKITISDDTIRKRNASASPLLGIGIIILILAVGIAAFAVGKSQGKKRK